MKVRQGFVSNSSSSSFLLYCEQELDKHWLFRQLHDGMVEALIGQEYDSWPEVPSTKQLVDLLCEEAIQQPNNGAMVYSATISDHSTIGAWCCSRLASLPTADGLEIRKSGEWR